jgi:hypothetical protein
MVKERTKCDLSLLDAFDFSVLFPGPPRQPAESPWAPIASNLAREGRTVSLTACREGVSLPCVRLSGADGRFGRRAGWEVAAT